MAHKLPLYLENLKVLLSTTMEKMVFLNFAARWDRMFGFKIFIKVMNLMWHLSSIR